MINAIYPVKFDSKGLPNKLKLELNGKEMWKYVADAAQESEMIDTVYMTGIRDDMQWFNENVKNKYTKFKWITRPHELTVNGIELLEVMKHAQSIIGGKNDLFVQLQGTKPLTKSKDLDKIINFFLSVNFIKGKEARLNSLFTVQKIETSVNWQYKADRNEKLNFKSCAICKIWDYNSLKKADIGTWGFGINHYNYFIPKHHIEVDDINDFKIADALLKAGY